MNEQALKAKQELEAEYEELAHFLYGFKNYLLECEHHDIELSHIVEGALGKTPDEFESQDADDMDFEEYEKYQEICRKYYTEFHKELDKAETFKEVLALQFLELIGWDLDYLDDVYEDKFSRALEIEELLEAIVLSTITDK